MQRTSELAVLSHLKQSAGQPMAYGASVGLLLEHAEHVIEVSRQLQHVSSQPETLIRTRAVLLTLHTLTPLLLCAAQTFHTFVTSSIAVQHLLLCAEVWIQTVQDVRKILHDITLQELGSPSLPAPDDKLPTSTNSTVMPLQSNHHLFHPHPSLHHLQTNQTQLPPQTEVTFIRKYFKPRKLICQLIGITLSS
jgi:hypothetical protein